MLPRAETLRIQDSVCIYQAQKHQRKGKATQLDTRAVRTGEQEREFVQGPLGARSIPKGPQTV